MRNWFANLKTTKIIENKVNKLKLKYYNDLIHSLKNKDVIPMNLDIEDVSGTVTQMSYDKNNNVQIHVTLDINISKNIILNHISNMIKKDTSLLDTELINSNYDIKDQHEISKPFMKDSFEMMTTS